MHIFFVKKVVSKNYHLFLIHRTRSVMCRALAFEIYFEKLKPKSVRILCNSWFNSGITFLNKCAIALQLLFFL
jgi:hypothetical protein